MNANAAAEVEESDGRCEVVKWRDVFRHIDRALQALPRFREAHRVLYRGIDCVVPEVVAPHALFGSFNINLIKILTILHISGVTG